ncbi:trypsin-like peptidase domain-containing protein [Marimonas sp. MJW-29]|uniref:Trypsin-like peptidase domain-containing protein n=1 Tax=Sulfitobacter sediminis TaxID=3234186 RepID=A0ABV3RND2_9RHOB
MANGDKYKGQFKDDQKDGLGVARFADGLTFVGEYSKDQQNGRGYLVWPHGAADFCQYTDGKLSDCVGKSVDDVAPALMEAYLSLSAQSRERIQDKLYVAGYILTDNSSVWRRDTFVGLISYAALELGTIDVQGKVAARYVIEALLQDIPQQDSPSPSARASCFNDPSTCSVKQLCYMATSTIDGRKVWRTSENGPLEYVEEAKRRGLACDVEVQVAEPQVSQDDETYRVASGTGFYVSNQGHIITNSHVIEGCEEIKVHSRGRVLNTIIIASDQLNDLALLKTDETPAAYFSLSRENPYALQDVIVAGFPFGDRLSSSLKFTQGIVSSVSGVGNNYSQIQIDAALQPGNSGGPILDGFGNVIAVAVAKLDLKKILEDYGVIPENTNFGVKSSAVRNLMEGNRITPESPSKKTLSKFELSDLATDGTVYLTCWMTTAQIEQLKTRKVMFEQFE